MSNVNSTSPNNGSSSESSFLSELAGEATSKLQALKENVRDKEAKAELINIALGKIYQFFSLFSRHANDLEPEIQRPYNLDNQTIFTPLKWNDAVSDYRKRDFSDNAFMDHVSFKVRLTSPAPVTVIRRFNQAETLKKELHAFGLRPADDLDKMLRSNQQETLQVSLAPDFLVRIRFQGNYDDDRIDMLCNNLEGFGAVAFKLAPEQITPHLLDEVGRYLIGRTDSLPAILNQTKHFQKQSSQPPRGL